jgi:hypothetical protein
VAAAFGGGLQGAASVPSPTGSGVLPGRGPEGPRREILFATDVFPIATLVDADLGIQSGSYAYYPDSGSFSTMLLELSHTPIPKSVVMHIFRAGRVLNATKDEVLHYDGAYGYTLRDRKIDLTSNRSFDNGPNGNVPTWPITGRLPRVEPGDALVVQYAYYPDWTPGTIFDLAGARAGAADSKEVQDAGEEEAREAAGSAYGPARGGRAPGRPARGIEDPRSGP